MDISFTSLLILLHLSSIAVYHFTLGVVIAPSGFVTIDNTKLVMWQGKRLAGGLYKAPANTVKDCLTLCLAEVTCVSFEFMSQSQDLKCLVHYRASADNPGCSNDVGHLSQHSQGGTKHYKIRNRCYITLPATNDRLVNDRTGRITASGATSAHDCSALCQLSDNCVAAEYHGGGCSLFPHLDTKPSCRPLEVATDFIVISQPCVNSGSSQKYSMVTRGYYGINFLTETSKHDSRDGCQSQCNAESACLGYAIDYATGNDFPCRIYMTIRLCDQNQRIDTNGHSWYTFVKQGSCPSVSTRTTPWYSTTSRTTVTVRTTLRVTYPPPAFFKDYVIMDQVQIRGGTFRSSSKSVQNCRQECDDSSSCEGFNYVSQGQLCYHLTAASLCLTPIKNHRCHHYRKKTAACTLEHRDFSVRGGKLEPTASGPVACEQSCRQAYDCRGFDVNQGNSACYLHFGNNICTAKRNQPGVKHYRLLGNWCAGEAEAVVAPNTRFKGGVLKGSASSALDCFHKCGQDARCVAVDFVKDTKQCWFFYSIDAACNTPTTDTCCDHLTAIYVCPSKPKPVKPQLVFVDIKTPIDWNTGFADDKCPDDQRIYTICQLIQTISFDGNVATLKYLGTLPKDKKLTLRFETETTMASQIQLLREKISDLLESHQFKHHSATITSHDIPARMEVKEVQPQIGPMSGGTLMSLIGINLHHVREVYIGQTECNTKVMTSPIIICTTKRLEDVALVNRHQNISVSMSQFTTTSIGFKFRYVLDPSIYSVNPLETIVSGGILLTVKGSGLESVHKPIMKTEAYARLSGKRKPYETVCVVVNTAEMQCPTPEFDLVDLTQRKRRKRDIVNLKHKVEFTIGFLLDGVTTYEHLSGALEIYNQITVYEDPVLEPFEGGSRTFVSTWPVSERVLEIKGERLTDGLQEDDYKIMIGEAVCQRLKLFSDNLACEPPSIRPLVRQEEQFSDGRIPVKVVIGNLVVHIGYMLYQQNLWEYPPSRYTIIGVSCGLFVIIVIICIFCCGCICAKSSGHKHRHKRPPSPQMTRNSSSSNSRSTDYPRQYNAHHRDDYRYPSPHNRQYQEDSRWRDYKERSRHNSNSEEMWRQEEIRNKHQQVKRSASHPPRKYSPPPHPSRINDLEEELDEVYGQVNTVKDFFGNFDL